MRRTETQRRVATAILAKPDEPIYGYDTSRKLGIKSGTLYPLLHRMLSAGWLTDAWDESWYPPRRFYRLTTKGALELMKLRDAEMFERPR